MNLSAVILAGGGSRRMGRDKAWVEHDGQPLLLRARERVRALGLEEIFVSGRPEGDYAAAGCPVLLDVPPAKGPLSGMERALEMARHPLVLVLAVDLPDMTESFLRKLTGALQPPAGVVPEWAGQLEPLAAVYPRTARPLLLEQLAAGRYAARQFAAACLEAGLVRAFPVAPTDAPCLRNCNCPADLPRPGATQPVEVS